MRLFFIAKVLNKLKPILNLYYIIFKKALAIDCDLSYY